MFDEEKIVNKIKKYLKKYTLKDTVNLILETEDLDKFLENINIIEKDLISIFEKNRIIKIKAHNTKFDPNIHQAMSEIDDEKSEPGTVLQEVQSGYMLGERLLRPALVTVSKKKTTKDQENKDNKGKK
jgi:molecular chaperone GrpE